MVETIKAATTERLRAYYEANYRPDNATLIVVGNIDPAKIEAEIKVRFADWKPVGKASAIDLGTPNPATKASEFVGEGARDGLTLSWVNPVDRRADTETRDREQIARFVALTVLNARIAERAAEPGSPYVGGQAVVLTDLMDSASITQIGIAAAPDKWAAALDVIIEQQRQAVSSPVGAEELERAKAQVLSVSQSAAAGAGTRTNDSLAGRLVASVNEDELFTSPEQDLELVKAVLADLTPETVAAALQSAFAGKGPVLFRTAQKEPVGVPALQAQIEASYGKPITNRAAEVAVIWPYTDFGRPGQVRSRNFDKELGATVVNFANGSRLIVKQTLFEKDRVYIDASFGNGRAGASEQHAHALWATSLLPVGGTGKLTVTDIQRWAQTGGKLVAVNLQTYNRTFSLTAVTRPADLVNQMQLLAAYARDPGFRPELGDQIAAIGPMISGQLAANPAAVFQMEADRLFGGGNNRYSDLPSTQDIAATKLDDISVLLKSELATAADVTMVGDNTVETAIELMQNTFAAGPAQARPQELSVSLKMPEGRAEPYVVTHGGRQDQAIYGAFWALPDYRSGPKSSYVGDVVSAILEARMVETVREKLGMTYSPKASATASIGLPGQGLMRVSIETPPENFDVFRDLLRTQVEDLSGKPVSADELERARKPLLEASAKRRESNSWWVTNLSSVLRQPLVRTWMLDEAPGLTAVTASDVQAFAAKYLARPKPVVIIAKAK